MNHDFLELVGIVIGDGNLWSDGSHGRVEITGNPMKDGPYFNYISGLIRKFTESKISVKERSGGLRLRVSSRKFFDSFIEFGMSQRMEKIENLKFLDDIETADRIPVIRGLMDTDGSVVRRSNGQVFMEISTSSKYLSNWLDNSLKDMGFRCFVASRRYKGTDRIEYNVWLSGKENIRKWVYSIGFSNKYKLDKSLSILSESGL